MAESQVLEKDEARAAAVRRPDSLAQTGELTCDELVARVRMVHEVLTRVMAENVDYGRIPGCGDKPTLLKPGAEKLCMTFRLAPSYRTEEIRDVDGHLTVIMTCTLTHITSGLVVAEGLGRASTRESKYAYRQANRKCPACGAEAIIKGKAEYGGGWLCFGKKGGCGAKFRDGDKTIEGQSVGRVLNEDLADQYNTVLKMGAKRAFVAATLSATAASSIFTQDLEDMETPPQATRPATTPAPPVVKRPAASTPPETKPETNGPTCKACEAPMRRMKAGAKSKNAGKAFWTCPNSTREAKHEGGFWWDQDWQKHLKHEAATAERPVNAPPETEPQPADDPNLPDTSIFDPPEQAAKPKAKPKHTVCPSCDGPLTTTGCEVGTYKCRKCGLVLNRDGEIITQTAVKCPACGSENVMEGDAATDFTSKCRDCGHEW